MENHAEALHWAPDDPSIYVQRSLTQLEQGKRQESIDSLLRARELAKEQDQLDLLETIEQQLRFLEMNP